MSVPAYSKTFRKILKLVSGQGETLYKVFQFALKVAYKYNGIGTDKGKGFRFLLKPLLSVFDSILFKKIREGFGGNLMFLLVVAPFSILKCKSFLCDWVTNLPGLRTY